MKIGVFDSGIGGVTVLMELLSFLPNEQYIYYSDSAHNPYGDKPKAEIIHLSQKACEYLLANGAEIIVIACNTASAEATDYLRKKFSSVPIYAIQPAVKAVYDSSPNPEKLTLTLATHATLGSTKFRALCTKYPVANLRLVDCNGLAELIENNQNAEVEEYLNSKIGKYRGQTENVILGCTHYPLIADTIRSTLGGEIKFFNGARGLARNLASRFSHLNGAILAHSAVEPITSQNRITFYDTSSNPSKERRFRAILKSYLNQ